MIRPACEGFRELALVRQDMGAIERSVAPRLLSGPLCLPKWRKLIARSAL